MVHQVADQLTVTPLGAIPIQQLSAKWVGIEQNLVQ
jgi:hypothetical protein